MNSEERSEPCIGIKYFVVAQICLERRGGGALKGFYRDIRIAIRSVGGGNRLAETDDGKRLILKGKEVR